MAENQDYDYQGNPNSIAPVLSLGIYDDRQIRRIKKYIKYFEETGQDGTFDESGLLIASTPRLSV